MPILSGLLKVHGIEVTFTMLELGALPLEGEPEPFHPLLDSWPGSKVHAFEVDPALCARLNKDARQGFVFHPQAIARDRAVRTFHETQHPMCASLYAPDERWPDVFHNLEVTRHKALGTLETVSLDQFADAQGVPEIDFIKLDIQGAELEAFQGGVRSLKNVLAIISEVEFVPMYVDQPLFGDVDAFLRQQGFMFHKFVGLCGRAAKPLVLNNNVNFATQHMWGDAMFITNIFNLASRTSPQLLKLAVLLELYNSPDMALLALRAYDTKEGTALGQEALDLYLGM